MKLTSKRAVFSLIVLLSCSQTQALFGDDEARKALLALRAQTETQQARNLEEQRTLRQGILDLQRQVDVLRKELAEQRGRADVLDRELELLRQQMGQRLQALEPVPVILEGKSVLVTPQEKQAFESALDLLRAADYAPALHALQRFLQKYPDSSYLPFVWYWQGNAHFALQQYRESLNGFKKMIAEYPQHSLAAEAWFASANIHLQMKDTRSARRAMEELIRRFPQSDSATRVREILPTLR